MVLGGIIVFVIFVAGVWMWGFFQANDFRVKKISSEDLKRAQKIMVVFPHPDDEAQSCAGTIYSLAKKGARIEWVILTKGERGTKDAHVDQGLKEVRLREAKAVAKILGVNILSVEDYPDNNIQGVEMELSKELESKIADSQPDVIITYDESGLYGHPDHVVVSKLLTKIVNSKFPRTKLWYISFPKNVLDKISLPEHMARNSEFKISRKYPNRRNWIGINGLLRKISAVYTYRSQMKSFVSGLPIKQIPLWFYLSLTPFEYFYVVSGR